MKKRFTLISEENLRNLIRRELLKEEDPPKEKEGDDEVSAGGEEEAKAAEPAEAEAAKEEPAKKKRPKKAKKKSRSDLVPSAVFKVALDAGVPDKMVEELKPLVAAWGAARVKTVLKSLVELAKTYRAFKWGRRWDRYFRNLEDRKGRASAEDRIKLVKTWIKSPPEGSDEKYGSFVEWYNKWVAIRKQQGEGSGHFGTRVALKLLADPAFASEERGKLGAGPEKTKKKESAAERAARMAAGKAAGRAAHRESIESKEGIVWHLENDKVYEYAQFGGKRNEDEESDDYNKWTPGKWHTRKQGTDKWISLKRYPKVIKKLEDGLETGDLMAVA